MLSGAGPYDVAVLGAGVAGLTCAAELQSRKYRVAVVEARERVGGRILTIRTPGRPPIEAGAQVIHGEHAATWLPIRAAGLAATPFSLEAPVQLAVDGCVYGPEELDSAQLQAPWKVEWRLRNSTLPDVPVSMLLESASERQRKIALEWLAQTWCADPDRLSAAGMAEVNGADISGRKDFFLPEGYDQLVRYLASGLDIETSAPVDAIRWEPGGVELGWANGSCRARAAVLTSPPGTAADIAFSPPLPPDKSEACGRIETGDALTIMGTLSEPSDRSAWVLLSDPPGGFWRIDKGSAMLTGWIRGNANPARELLQTPVEFWAPVLDALPWLGRRLESQQLIDWGADPYSKGGYCYPAVGDGQAQHLWARPVDGTLFFAGDSTCGRRHPGTVHGAVESGLRAADEVASELIQDTR